MATVRKRIKKNKVIHRDGSKAAQIEKWVESVTSQSRGSPKVLAECATFALGFKVERSDVSHALGNLGLSRKHWGLVPGLGVRSEREKHLFELNILVSSAAQLVFIDEKKFHGSEFHERFTQCAYAPVGERPPRRSALIYFIAFYLH